MIYPKRLAGIISAALLLPMMVCALGISAFKTAENGDAEITFCNKLKIVNIAFTSTPQGWKLEMPLDLGGYHNLFFTSQDLSTMVKKCFQGSCSLSKEDCSPKWEIVSSKKVSDSAAIVNISFDKQLTAVFFLNKYQRAGKESYRLSGPMDLQFIDAAYRKKLRDFVIEKTKNLL